MDDVSSAWQEIRVRSGAAARRGRRDDKEGVAFLCHIGYWWSGLQIAWLHSELVTFSTSLVFVAGKLRTASAGKHRRGPSTSRRKSIVMR